MKGFKEFLDEEEEDNTPEEVEEGILQLTMNRDLDRWIDVMIKKPLYKKAVRYYLDLRRKTSGEPMNAHKALLKTEKITGLDYRQIKSVLDDMIAKGKLPKHLGWDTSVQKLDKIVGPKHDRHEIV